jgi:hypothetical protein
MTQDYKHPITPPPELVQQWLGEFFGCTVSGELSDSERFLATRAAQWGADQELEATIELADGSALPEKDRYFDGMTVASLRAARRPKPPSLKELALAVLENEPEADDMKELVVFDVDQVEIIRRALEALTDD